MNILSGKAMTRLCGGSSIRPVLTFAIFVVVMLAGVSVLRAQTADSRLEAQIAVQTDLTVQIPDEVSIRIMNSNDRALLESILAGLSLKLNAPFTGVTYTAENADFPDDKGLAVTFNMGVVPRDGGGYLPIAPFVEVFAPHAKRLRLVYDVKGPFVYRGYRDRYADEDVSFTVLTPPASTSTVAEAFYAFDVNIKNSALTSVSFLNYPEQGRKAKSGLVRRIVLAAGVAVIIFAFGLLLALVLPRRSAPGSRTTRNTATRDDLTGGTHD